MESDSHPKKVRTFSKFLAASDALKMEPQSKLSGARCKTSWLSTKLSRNSSMTSKSRSVPIFVHVGDLLKPPGSSPQFPPAQETSEHTSEDDSNQANTAMGINRTTPTVPHNAVTPQTVMGGSRTPPTEPHYVVSPQTPFPSQPNGDTKDESTTEVTERATRPEDIESETNTKSIYSLFPEPPDPLEHFDKWFPEIPQQVARMEEKQKARVDKSLPQPPYHVFDSKKKMQIVILVSMAGILSPLSTSIYLPALTAIASEFQMSTTLVLLTVMVFMVFQGIAPFFWMPLCNTLGRRPIFIVTLIIFVGANIGLVFSKSFAALMVLRSVQSIGSAALTATCAAVIGDISASKERGRFIGLFGAVLMFTFISPVLGGILTHWMGFRSIFWFLFAFGSLVLILIIMVLPETLRSIAGNGTIRLKPFQQPLFNVVRSSSDTPFDSDLAKFSVRTKSLSMESLFEPLRCLAQKDVLATAFLGSVAFAICTTVITTTTTMLEQHYQFSAFIIGLTFLPAGAGSMLSFFLMGYLMDHDLRVVEADYRQMYDLEKHVLLDHKLLSDFPIERARLRNAWWIIFIFVGTTAAYGFSFSGRSICGPLILQFFIASSATAFLLLNGVFIADLYHGYGSVTLAVNLIRFLMGALAVGTVQLALDRVGNGFTFLIMAMAMLGLVPMMIVQWVFGRPWKARRNSTWPRKKLSVDLGLPDFERLAEKFMPQLKGLRLPKFRTNISESRDASRWPR
ncbi:Itaconate transport protein [Lachnellula suecica]|uniref:Itaconate transport protein n=1 Tax=Lachnellula suecica TaxID=602035 RepID=A0A8T9BXX2_9HELO|nr:Itaconate transport protein [Lachnellula suecica]